LHFIDESGGTIVPIRLANRHGTSETHQAISKYFPTTRSECVTVEQSIQIAFRQLFVPQ
jgi:hypothetical protein